MLIVQQTQPSSCSYLIDLDFPHRESNAGGKRPFRDDKSFEVVKCWPFLDNTHSSQLTRSFYLPFADQRNRYGDFCLLRNTNLRI